MLLEEEEENQIEKKKLLFHVTPLIQEVIFLFCKRMRLFRENPHNSIEDMEIPKEKVVEISGVYDKI